MPEIYTENPIPVKTLNQILAELSNLPLVDRDIYGGEISGASYKSNSNGARVEILPSDNQSVGMVVTDESSIEVFKIIIAGTDVGDVTIGDYDGGQGARWDDSAGIFSILGTLSATAGTIGAFNIGADYIRDVANSFGLASTVTGGDDVRFWAGDTFANRATAVFRVTEAGAVTASNMTITGGSVAVSTLSGVIGSANLNVADRGWMQTCVFSASDADTVAWAGGSFIASDGTTYTITGANTGNMSARTYIYLDTAVSTTAYQTTTTAATAVGAGKVLIATAINGTDEAEFETFGGVGGLNINASSIVSLSITANEIAASTITSGKLSVSQLSAIAADLGTITAGSININSGVASINASGDATFKSIQIGGSTRQFSITDNGLFNYGDGSDGAATFADQGAAPTGTTKTDNTAGATIFRLDRDVYYTTFAVNATVTLNTNGYRIFFTTSSSISGTISRNGNGGTNGQSSGSFLGGGGGAALADGYLKGSVAGGGGGNGGNNSNGQNGTTGTAVSNSLGSNGSAGGAGGASSGNTGGTSTGGTATASNVKLLIGIQLAELLDVSSTGAKVKYTASAGGGGGGGGASSSVSEFGGGGGGAASGGGVIAIYGKSITVNSGGVISANGGVGGNGGTSSGGDAGGGGGGAGGDGGQIILVYNEYTNSGSVTVTGGAGGNGGGLGLGGTGSVGSAGTAGSDGNIRTFQLSL